MAALNKPDIVKLSISFDILQNLVCPGTSSIDQQTSPNFLALMCTGIFERDGPVFPVTARRHDLGSGLDYRSAIRCITGS